MRPRLRRAAAVFALAVLLAGCTMLQSSPEIGRKIERVAILPIEPLEPASAVTVEERPPVPEEAPLAVTARIYGVLAERSELRVVPDLAVADALATAPLRRADTIEERAAALAEEIGADAVILGTVSRFRERVGTRYGARKGASVSFELRLMDAETGEILWRGQFDRTQQALTSNLFDFWMFWRAGAHWFTARELTRLGVEALVEDMLDALGH